MTNEARLSVDLMKRENHWQPISYKMLYKLKTVTLGETINEDINKYKDYY